jgi:HEAT repeat protein
MDVRDVHELEATGDVAGLLLTLGATEPRVRQEACYALGQLSCSETAADLTGLLADDDHENVRAAAAEALGWLRQVSAVPQLIRSLREDPDDDVRTRAAAALGGIGDRTAVPALQAAALEHPAASFHGLHRESQFEAVRALGMLLPDEAASAALEAIEKVGGELERVARQAALPTIVWGSYHQQALRHLVTEAGWVEGGWLIAAELRADPDNAYDADAVAVIALASGMTIGYLRKDYAADLSPRLRVDGPMPCQVQILGGHRLGTSMVSMGGETGAPARRPATAPAQQSDPLRDEAASHLASSVSPQMTVVCLRHLGSVSTEADTEFVAAYLQRPEPSVRAAAVTVLGEWRATRAAQRLTAMLTDPDTEVQAAVRRALDLIGAPERATPEQS